MQTLTLDIMLGDRFVCTLRYKHNPAFILTVKELADFVVSKRPTLRDKPFRIFFAKKISLTKKSHSI